MFIFPSFSFDTTFISKLNSAVVFKKPIPVATTTLLSGKSNVSEVVILLSLTSIKCALAEILVTILCFIGPGKYRESFTLTVSLSLNNNEAGGDLV